MARLLAYIKEVNGRHIGDGVYFDEAEASSLISQGVAMDAADYRKMVDSELSKAVDVAVAGNAKTQKQDKALEKPNKDKMVRTPTQKK